MKTLAVTLAAVATTVSIGFAQQAAFDRLPADVLQVVPPSDRVSGEPGRMTIRRTSCQTLPLDEVRRRIVDVAVQEWGFFGFKVVDQTRIEEDAEARRRTWRRRPRLSPTESARVAGSIGGYWTVTPQGAWILDQQNELWRGSEGISTRWRYPWSAAFVSWVMCEAGLGEATRFQRAVAHHVYIDQAIRARAAGTSGPAFAAYDVGQTPIVPGDLLCSARRPAYGSIEERRRQMGDGARTHCDIVVKVDEARNRILAIGGNVRGSVSLKLLPASREPGQELRPVRGRRRPFAHLTLRADPIGQDALDRTPTLRALVCGDEVQAPSWLTAADIVSSGSRTGGC